MINYCAKLHFTWGVPSVFTCVLGAQYDHLIETVLLSTNSIFLLRLRTQYYQGIRSGCIISLCGNGGSQTALRIVINLPSEFVTNHALTSLTSHLY